MQKIKVITDEPNEKRQELWKKDDGTLYLISHVHLPLLAHEEKRWETMAFVAKDEELNEVDWRSSMEAKFNEWTPDSIDTFAWKLQYVRSK